jgi:hypothetical protein
MRIQQETIESINKYRGSYKNIVLNVKNIYYLTAYARVMHL